MCVCVEITVKSAVKSNDTAHSVDYTRLLLRRRQSIAINFGSLSPRRRQRKRRLTTSDEASLQRASGKKHARTISLCRLRWRQKSSATWKRKAERTPKKQDVIHLRRVSEKTVYDCLFFCVLFCFRLSVPHQSSRPEKETEAAATAI